ncbi:5-formyltetrahydrofolate cyclo-ligase [bacterium]|nr:5-formyltetrahydrofolate cyclo-ligase [bacterium]
MSGKEPLRMRGRDLRKRIENAEALSGIICEKIMRWNLFAEARRIMSYYPFDGEADIQKVNKAAARSGELYLPSVVSVAGISSISAKRFFEGAVCVTGKYGISEPPHGAPVIKPEDIELIFVPGIVFSRTGERIGFGSGYYDRFLSSCVSAVKAGVCFEAQIEGNFKTEDSDVKMDFVITEKRIYGEEK